MPIPGHTLPDTLEVNLSGPKVSLVVMSSSLPKQSLVTLDVEGVLTPEIWIAVAEKTGIAELRRTTKDEPDYAKLMEERLSVLAQHGIRLGDIQSVISGLAPLSGAREFLDELRSRVQVVLLSDTFEQFAAPLMAQLGQPTILCHRLDVDDEDRIVAYQARIEDPKLRAVTAFKGLNYRVVAAGDSYNDISMLKAADDGFLFRSPVTVQEEFPQFPALEDYSDLLDHLIRSLT